MMEVLLEASARATPLLAVVLVGCALLRRGAPALRHLALTVGLCGFLVIPVLSAVLPSWSVWVPAAVAEPIVSRLSSSVTAVAAVGTAEPSNLAEPVRMVVLLWAAGTVLLLGRVAGGVWGTARLARSVCRSGRVHRMGRRGRVRVTVTESVDVPQAVGLVRPVILFPAPGHWTGRRRRAALAHEVAHVRRGDGWTTLLGAVVRALHWPNPLVWLAVRHLRAAGEEACDVAVLEAGVPRLEYAQLLVRMARLRGRHADALPAATAMARRDGLSRRVEALLDDRGRPARPGRRPLLAAGLTLALGCLAAASPAVPPPAFTADRLAARYGIGEELAGRILDAADAERIDPAIAFGLVSVESDFRNDRTSDRGAIGLTQLLPSTAAWLEPGMTRDRLRDPETNLRLGFRLLRNYLERFRGDRERALLAYHIGPANVGMDGSPHLSGYPDRVFAAAPDPADTGAP
ncbi:MAG: M56 family metallopeptidase [Gemmatimonadota bacterium]